MHSNEPTNAEIRSSKVILISPRPKSMWSSRKMSPPTTAPTIPKPTLAHTPKPRLLKVMRRPASVPASAPITSQTMILPIGIDMIESLLSERMFHVDFAQFRAAAATTKNVPIVRNDVRALRNVTSTASKLLDRAALERYSEQRLHLMDRHVSYVISNRNAN